MSSSSSSSSSSPNCFIINSRKFYGHYQVVHGQDVIDCHNIGTARQLRDRLLLSDTVTSPVPPSVPSSRVADTRNIEQEYGCLTGGLGNTPAITWLLTGRVERVHNWATARSIKGANPPTDNGRKWFSELIKED